MVEQPLFKLVCRAWVDIEQWIVCCVFSLFVARLQRGWNGSGTLAYIKFHLWRECASSMLGMWCCLYQGLLYTSWVYLYDNSRTIVILWWSGLAHSNVIQDKIEPYFVYHVNQLFACLWFSCSWIVQEIVLAAESPLCNARIASVGKENALNIESFP